MTDRDRTTVVRRTPWPESVSRAVGTPLQPSVVYASDDPDALDAQYAGQTFGYTYAREGHPNADVLAAKLDALEGAEGGLITASGMAAVAAVLMGLLEKGDHVIAGDQLYGRSLRMLRDDLPRMGVSVSFVDPTDADSIRAAVRPETRLILIEVLSNPTLRLADMAGAAHVARDCGALLVVDNTFTTPLGARAFDLGADIVLHSVTKLLAGHSDVTLGYVAARDVEIRRLLTDFAVTVGLTPSPFDCWLAERGLQTFELRFARASDTTAALADAIAEHPSVLRVVYPGRDDHPDHMAAGRVLTGGFGNMLAFELAGGRDAANAFVRAATDLVFAPTLGDVATLISHPASSSHRGLSEKARHDLGITEGMFRVSVGIEPKEFVLRAFAGALDAHA